MPNIKKKTLFRNIGWISLLTVWSFWAGGFFNLGWNRDYSVSYYGAFVNGGVAMLIVLSAIGFITRNLAKKNGSIDSSKIALIVVSTFTVFFMLLAWLKYDDVQRAKFIQDLEFHFVSYYTEKAERQNLETENLKPKLYRIYSWIRYDLKTHPELNELMKLKTTNELFEKNGVIRNLSLSYFEIANESDFESDIQLKILFKPELNLD